jgi:hypothetical protein
MPQATGELESQKKLVLAQGSPSEEALSRNLFFVTTAQHTGCVGCNHDAIRLLLTMRTEAQLYVSLQSAVDHTGITCICNCLYPDGFLLLPLAGLKLRPGCEEGRVGWVNVCSLLKQPSSL